MFQGALAREGAFTSVESMRDTLAGLSSDISEKMQMAPVRALSVSLGQIMQTAAGGRGGILERAGRAREMTSRAQKAVTKYEAAQQKSREAIMRHGEVLAGTVGAGPGDMFKTQDEKDAALAKARAERSDAFQARMYQKGVVEQRTTKASEAVSSILNKRQMVQAQAAGTIGIVGGTMAFSAAMAVAQMAAEQLGKAMEQGVDRVLGFAQTAAKASAQLAQSIQGSGGNMGALHAQAGQVGAVGNFGALSVMAGREAALQNMKASIDLYRSNRWARDNGFTGQTGSVRGIGNNMGNGVLPGTFLDWINSTPGALEQFQGALPQADLTGRNLSGFFELPNADVLAGTSSGGVDPVRQLQYWGEDLFGDPKTKAQNLANMRSPMFTETQVKDIKDAGDRFNETVVKAGTQFGKMVYDPKNTEALKNWSKALQAAGMDRVKADKMAASGLYGVDASGKAITSDIGVNRLFGGFLQGQMMPTASEMFEGNRRNLQAQIGQMYNQQAIQQQFTIPAQFAQQMLGNPLPTSSGVGIIPTGGTIDPTNAAMFKQYGPQIDAARGELGKLRDAGYEAMKALAPTDQQRAQLMSLVEGKGGIKDLAAQAQKLSEANIGAQLALGEAQYARQIYLAKRSLGDALGLEGKKTALVNGQVVAATRLGELQRQQVMVSRQSEQLSLAMNQRQLNFAIALSRINTPGSTPIERATRAREQDLLNRDQQRQQDYAEKGFSLGKQIQNIEFSRSTQDQIKELGLIMQGHTVDIQIRNTQPIIDANNQLISYKQNLVSSITETGNSMKELRTTALAEVQAATGDFTEETAKMVDKQVSDMSTKWKGFFAGLTAGGGTGTGTGTMNQGPNGPKPGDQAYTVSLDTTKTTIQADSVTVAAPGPSPTPHAAGTVFDTRGKYDMTVGEAGTEHVAVLRNPRRMPWTQMVGGGGGGGGASVTVNMNGPWHVRNDGDIDMLADSVARRVEDRLNRRAAVFATRES